MRDRDFKADLIGTFMSGYFDIKGGPVKGQAVSYALTEMRLLGWKNLGSLNAFETACENWHFTIIEGRNKRGQKCRIVTI